MREKKYWFKRKRYGLGWTPVTRQGWLLVAANIAFIIGVSAYMFRNVEKGDEEPMELFLFFGLITLSTTLMILIARKKSPPAKWRWGKKDSDSPEEDF